MLLFILKLILISVLAPNTWKSELCLWLRHCTVWWMQEQFNARQQCHKCLGQIKEHTLNFSRWQNTLESRLLLWLQSHKRHVQRQKSPRPSFMRHPILCRTICTWPQNSFHGIIGHRWLLLRFQIKIIRGNICYNIWINVLEPFPIVLEGRAQTARVHKKSELGERVCCAPGRGECICLHICNYVCNCD